MKLSLYSVESLSYLIKKFKPPSPCSIKGASVGFVHTLDAMHFQVQGLPLEPSQFPQPTSHRPTGKSSIFPHDSLG